MKNTKNLSNLLKDIASQVNTKSYVDELVLSNKYIDMLPNHLIYDQKYKKYHTINTNKDFICEFCEKVKPVSEICPYISVATKILKRGYKKTTYQTKKVHIDRCIDCKEIHESYLKIFIVCTLISLIVTYIFLKFNVDKDEVTIYTLISAFFIGLIASIAYKDGLDYFKKIKTPSYRNLMNTIDCVCMQYEGFKFKTPISTIVDF